MDVLVLSDLGVVIVAAICAGIAVHEQIRTVPLAEFLSVRVRIQNVAIFSIFLFSWNLIFRSFRLYESRRLAKWHAEVWDILSASSCGTLLLFAVKWLFHIQIITPLFLCVFWSLTSGATISCRALMRSTLAFFRSRGRNLRHVAIVGTGPHALAVARWLESEITLGYRIVGFVDEEWHGLDVFKRSGYILASSLDSFGDFLRKNIVDEVMIALPYPSMYQQARAVAAICQDQGITVRMTARLWGGKAMQAFAETVDNNLLTTYRMTSMDGWPVFVKRVIDIVISAVVLIVCSPVLILTAMAIKLTSPGPVFFMQNRLGLNKRPFRVYKFRTMVADAETRMAELEHRNEVSGPVFKIWNDPRITPLGRILRKASIDELPQLFNVLRGDMSLVGPRPLPIRDCQGLEADWQRRRFSVKPGITCLWQIGGRSSTPFHRWMELDLQYIEKWSLWLDLEILLRTIPAVIRGTGAA